MSEVVCQLFLISNKCRCCCYGCRRCCSCFLWLFFVVVVVVVVVAVVAGRGGCLSLQGLAITGAIGGINLAIAAPMESKPLSQVRTPASPRG